MKIFSDSDQTAAKSDAPTNPEKQSNERKADPSKGSSSSPPPDKANQNLLKSLMPNVPLCKASGSSDEDGDNYDELYSMATHDSSNLSTSKKGKPSDNIDAQSSGRKR